jgi:hypothetical protein
VSEETDVDELFRAEAVEFATRQRGPGELLRVSAGRTSAAYWALLALTIAGAAASLFVRIDDEPLLYLVVPALKTLFERLHA